MCLRLLKSWLPMTSASDIHIWVKEVKKKKEKIIKILAIFADSVGKTSFLKFSNVYLFAFFFTILQHNYLCYAVFFQNSTIHKKGESLVLWIVYPLTIINQKFFWKKLLKFWVNNVLCIFFYVFLNGFYLSV